MPESAHGGDEQSPVGGNRHGVQRLLSFQEVGPFTHLEIVFHQSGTFVAHFDLIESVGKGHHQRRAGIIAALFLRICPRLVKFMAVFRVVCHAFAGAEEEVDRPVVAHDVLKRPVGGVDTDRHVARGQFALFQQPSAAAIAVDKEVVGISPFPQESVQLRIGNKILRA